MKDKFESSDEYWDLIIKFIKSSWLGKTIYKARDVFKNLFNSEDIGCFFAPLKLSLFLGLLAISIGLAFFLLRHAIKLAEFIGEYTLEIF